MGATLRFRDAFKLALPWWLSERRAAGKTVGYRFLWAGISVLDALTEELLQGMDAAWPGFGTPTALPYIARGRGLLRGQADTDDTFAARLRTWLDRWEQAGSALALALAIHEYLGNSPSVRVIQRPRIASPTSTDPDNYKALWVTVAADGTVTRDFAVWDWDSVSHPERNPSYWSDLWVVVYPTQWAMDAGTWGDGSTWTDDGFGMGHHVSHEETDAIKGLVAQWKSAHSRVRAIIWTSDAALFDPTSPSSCPDGTWGGWGGTGSGSRTASGRNRTTCAYWEPR